MKKLFKVALVAGCMLFVGNFAKAQTKLAYVNFDAIMGQMPEAKTIKSQLDIYQKQFVDELTKMNTTLQTKANDYQVKKATMTDATRTSTEAELQDMNNRMQQYQTTAQQKVEEKSNELVKPLSDKVRATVTAVAKEKGFNYVLDSGRTALVVAPEADDLTEAVKAKLGIK